MACTSEPSDFKQPITPLKELLLCRNLPLLLFHSIKQSLLFNFCTNTPQTSLTQLHLHHTSIHLFILLASSKKIIIQELSVLTSKLTVRPGSSEPAHIHGCSVEPGYGSPMNSFPEQGNYGRYCASGGEADPQQGLLRKTIARSSALLPARDLKPSPRNLV